MKDDQPEGIILALNEETATEVSAAANGDGSDETSGRTGVATSQLVALERGEEDGGEEERGGRARDEGGLRRREEERLEVEA